MGKKSTSTLSFANLTDGKKRNKIGKKKVKKAAKFHLKEMTISKKKFRKMNDEYDKGSIKKQLMKYRREHANELSELLLEGKLKNPEKYEDKLQDCIEEGKLFDPTKKSRVRKVYKKNPALFTYTHIVYPIDGEIVRSIMKKKVNKLSELVDDKTATRIAPLSSKSDAVKVMRLIMKVATEKDSPNFDAKDFFNAIRPDGCSKKQWKHVIVSTVLGIRGHSNNSLKEITKYAIDLLGDMSKDQIKKHLKKYADTITRVSESGEKLNFLITLKDLSDDPKIEKVLDDNQKIATVIGQL